MVTGQAHQFCSLPLIQQLFFQVLFLSFLLLSTGVIKEGFPPARRCNNLASNLRGRYRCHLQLCFLRKQRYTVTMCLQRSSPVTFLPALTKLDWGAPITFSYRVPTHFPWNRCSGRKGDFVSNPAKNKVVPSFEVTGTDEDTMRIQ